MDWNQLIDEGELASVFPPEYARFARPVKEGLTVFLSGLPPVVQQEMVAAQLQLGPQACVSTRLGRLARLSPVLQKLGQVLARDQRIAPALRRELSQLEWLPPSASLASIEAALHRELGPLAAHGIRLAPRPVAEASVAIVIPFAQTADPDDEGRRWTGVFKLLKPGIEARLALELDLLSQVGRRLDARCDDLGIPALEYQETFDQVSDLLRHEIRLDGEQRLLADAARCYAGDPRVQVPRLLEPCSPRVTAMERVEGSKLDRATIPSPIERRRLADLAIEALVAQPLFSRDEEALFHGDPHAGNLFHTVDGRLALLDWSLAGRLSAAHRTVVTQIALAAATGRPHRIEALLGQLALDDAYDRHGLQAAVARSLGALRGGQLPGFTWIVALLDDAVHAGRLRLPADLILYRKCLLTLAGVAEDLAGEPGRADAVLQREFLRHFAAEWPWRWLRDPFSRDSATRLSNSDLVGASFDLVSATLQLWLGPWSLWRGGSRPAARPPH